MPSLLGDTPRSLSRMAFSIASSESRSCGLDQQLPRPREPEIDGELLQRHLRAVVVDRDALDERRGGPPGAHRGELRLGVGDGLVHLVHRFEERLIDHVDQRNQAVATSGHASTARSQLVDEGAHGAALDDGRSEPFFDMSKTTIGMLLSRQKAIAVASITLRSLVITPDSRSRRTSWRRHPTAGRPSRRRRLPSGCP